MCEGYDEDYLDSSREITAGRILLESPYGWQWYLGDRVTRQSMRSAFPQVPGPLPPRVLRTSSYTLEEIRRYTVPDGRMVQFLRPEMDYDAYRERYLAGPLGVVRERVRRMTSELDRAIRAATGRAAGEGTSRGVGQESTEVPVRETVGVTEVPGWSVWVSTPDGEEGALEIPRPPTGLRPLQRPV